MIGAPSRLRLIHKVDTFTRISRILKKFPVYYKSIKREPKIRGTYECRCDERLQTKTKKFTCLPYTGGVFFFCSIRVFCLYYGPDTTGLVWRRPGNLRAVVEVVPVVPGADPVVVRGGVVGLVVGVSGDVVEMAGLGVLAGGLGVEGSGGLTVGGREHRKKEMYPGRCGRRDNLFIMKR